MSESKHTPLPWRSVQLGSEGARIYPECDDLRERMKYIADVSGRDTLTDFANSEFIVRACNAHEALVAACREALKRFTGHSTCYECGAEEREACVPDCISLQLRNALALAEGHDQ